ncbi:MAG: right-handed parallel beta-helix repeat-containing protein [Bdellovibrionota bacterium]
MMKQAQPRMKAVFLRNTGMSLTTIAVLSLHLTACSLLQSTINIDTGSFNSKTDDVEESFPSSLPEGLTLVQSSAHSATFAIDETMGSYLIRLKPQSENLWTEFSSNSNQVSLSHLEVNETYNIQYKNMNTGEWSAQESFVFDGKLRSEASEETIPTYYVSNSGDDANSGSKEEPIQSLVRAEELLNLAQGPVAILFERGGTWYGSMTLPPIAGSNDNNRPKIGSYGQGALPRIVGAPDPASLTWTEYSGPIYSTTINLPGAGAIFIDDEMFYPGRSPLFKMDGGDKDTIYSEDLLGGNYTDYSDGVQVTHRGTHWSAETQDWETYTTTTINLSGMNKNVGEVSWTEGNNNPNGGEEGNGFYLYNHLNYVDQVNEWSYKPSMQKLFLYTDATTLNKDIRIPVVERGLHVTGDYYDISDLNLEYYYKDAIFVEAAHVRIQFCDISNNYNSAIYANGGTDYLEIYHNYISNISGVGVYLFFSDYSSVGYNTIEDISSKTWGRSTGMHNAFKAASNQFSVAITGKSTIGNHIFENEIKTSATSAFVWMDKTTSSKKSPGRYHESVGRWWSHLYFRKSESKLQTMNNTIRKNIIETSPAPNNQIGYKVGNLAFPPSTMESIWTTVRNPLSLKKTSSKDVCGCILLNRNNNGHIVKNNILYGDNRLIQITNGDEGVISQHTIMDNLLLGYDPSVYSFFLLDESNNAAWTPGMLSNNTYLSPYTNIFARLQVPPPASISSDYTFSQWVGFSAESGSLYPKTGWTFTSKANALNDMQLLVNSTPLDKVVAIPAGHELVSGSASGNTVVVPAFSAIATIKQ